jgi:hypothetical protein
VQGAAGVIYGHDGNQIMKFAWGLGYNSNNQAEVLVVYMGMKLIRADKSSRSLSLVT